MHAEHGMPDWHTILVESILFIQFQRKEFCRTPIIAQDTIPDSLTSNRIKDFSSVLGANDLSINDFVIIEDLQCLMGCLNSTCHHGAELGPNVSQFHLKV
jgi:hypothetical protein